MRPERLLLGECGGVGGAGGLGGDGGGEGGPSGKSGAVQRSASVLVASKRRWEATGTELSSNITELTLHGNPSAEQRVPAVEATAACGKKARRQ